MYVKYLIFAWVKLILPPTVYVLLRRNKLKTATSTTLEIFNRAMRPLKPSISEYAIGLSKRRLIQFIRPFFPANVSDEDVTKAFSAMSADEPAKRRTRPFDYDSSHPDRLMFNLYLDKKPATLYQKLWAYVDETPRTWYSNVEQAKTVLNKI